MEKCTVGKRLFDKSFKYTPSVGTDIRKTFRKERARLAALQEAREQGTLEAGCKVSTLKVCGKKISTV